MQATRVTYTDKQAIQKYISKCAVSGEEVKDIKEVKQDKDFIRLFTYDNELVYAFNPEVQQTNHSFAVGRI